MDTFYQRAYSLISSQKAREAFNIDAEPAKIRDEYGRNAGRPAAADGPPAGRRGRPVGHPRLRRLGHARRDRRRHADARCRRSTRRSRRLIRDLDRTGLLERTLVMVSSEFGRTPKINKDAGRDHWPKVFSVVLAGGGIKRGYIYGASNATASEPERDPIGPEDLATTVYHQLGIVADKELMAPGNRPDRDRRRRQGRQGTAGLTATTRAASGPRCSIPGPDRLRDARSTNASGAGIRTAATEIAPPRDSRRPPCISALLANRPAGPAPRWPRPSARAPRPA